MIDGKYRYFAFISYKREDERWAKWLQYQLEHYKLPSSLNGRSDLPKEIRPIFKDTSELSVGNLPDQIHNALELSKYLIVICSPRSAKSEWVNKEAGDFISMGRTRNIVPFIIEGHPFAADSAEECFPQSIRQIPEEEEILGANINEIGRDVAVVKVVSRLFDLRFDDLWRRREREQKRKRNLVITSLAALVLMISGIALWMYHQKNETQRANWKMMQNQARMVSEKSKTEIQKGYTYDALLALLELMPQDRSRPFVPELEEALRTAYDSLKSQRWNKRYFDNHYDFISFADDDSRIICQDSLSIDIYDTKTLIRQRHFHVPDNLRASPFFLSPQCDTVFFMDSLRVMCFRVSDNRKIKELDYTLETLDRCMDACGHRIGYQEWPWISEWKKYKNLPDDAVILEYQPQRKFVFYCQDIEDEFGIQSRYVLYDCQSKEALRVLDQNGKPFRIDEWCFITSASFSPDGSRLVVAFSNGGGTIYDLNDFSTTAFDCGASGHCAHYSNYLEFGRNGQILHSSMFDSFKVFDGTTFALVDSLRTSFSDSVSGQMNSEGNICIIGDSDDCFIWYKNNDDRASVRKDGFKLLKSDKLYSEDTILDKRFHIRVDEDGTLWFEDLKGEYEPWNKSEKGRYIDVKGYFQDNKYIGIIKEGFRDAQYGAEILDIHSGQTVFTFPTVVYIDEIYYNDDSEQLAIGNDEEPFIDCVYDFPSLDHLINLCRMATKGMELSQTARKRFYLE